MYVLTVALRYLRTRPMAWVSGLIMAVIVVLYLLVISVMEGFTEHDMKMLRSMESHITVRVGQISWGIMRPEPWAGEVAKVDGVKSASATLETSVVALPGKLKTVGQVKGIDLDAELKYGALGEEVEPRDLKEFGEHDAGGKTINGCILAGRWAEEGRFGLKLGSLITFIILDQEGTPRSFAFKVVGFSRGKSEMLPGFAYVDRKLLAKKMGQEGCASGLNVWVEDDPDRADLDEIRLRVRNRMLELFAGDARVKDQEMYEDLPTWSEMLEVETWREKMGNLYRALSIQINIMRFIMCLFLIFVVIIIMLVLSRVVAEKIRDIGALRALGATPAGIRRCFLLQGLAICGFGVLAGLAASYFIIGHLNDLERAFSWCVGTVTQREFSVFPKDSFFIDRIPTRTRPFDVLLIAVLSLAAGILGALLPAWRASRMNTVECLRHE